MSIVILKHTVMIKRTLIILFGTFYLLSCEKAVITPDCVLPVIFTDTVMTNVVEDSMYYYISHFRPAPRDVNHLWAMTGSCKSPQENNGWYILDASTSFNNRYTYEEFAISIQTSNTPLEYKLNTFNGKPACFKFGEYAWTMFDYLNEENPVYSNILNSIKRRIYKDSTSDNKIGSTWEPPIFYEYRNDIIEDINIYANISLFNRDAGEDLSDKFNITMFYMNAMGQPSYIVQSETGEIAYTFAPGECKINHKGDNNLNTFVSCHYNISKPTDDPYVSKNINLKEWAKGKYYADPALYVQFAEKPSDGPCKVKFTVTLKTPTKILTSETPEITLY